MNSMRAYEPRRRKSIVVKSAFANGIRRRGDYRSPLRESSTSFNRVAKCSECGADLYARAGQDWRHEHNGSYWCSTNAAVSTSWAFPSPATIEVVKYLHERVATYRGSRRHVMLHTTFHKPKHRLESTNLYTTELNDWED